MSPLTLLRCASPRVPRTGVVVGVATGARSTCRLVDEVTCRHRDALYRAGAGREPRVPPRRWCWRSSTGADPAPAPSAVQQGERRHGVDQALTVLLRVRLGDRQVLAAGTHA